MSIDVNALWNFGDPAESEARFRAALDGAAEEDTLILQTQIARTYGLRREFERALALLADIEAGAKAAGGEAEVRYYLELGRSLCSTAHPPESQTREVKEQARAAYMQAVELAKAAGLDGLAIDALHMMTMVDTEPEEQLAWNAKAMALLEGSDQPAAKKWEGSLRNNTGYALYQMERYDDALAEFRLALAIREVDGDAGRIRIAHWMIAWTLRAMGQLEEALEIQLRLEKEWDEEGAPDPYVYKELELLYKALGDEEKAAEYAKKRGS